MIFNNDKQRQERKVWKKECEYLRKVYKLCSEEFYNPKTSITIVKKSR